MPFVVDWTPVSQMGSLAVSAGQAQGRTAGNASFIQRQSAVDAQTADINQRNREIGFAARQAPYDDARRANLEAGLMDRRFSQESALNEQQAGYQYDLAQAKARPMKTPDIIEAESLARESGRQQARTSSRRFQQEQQREDYVNRAVSAGATEDEAQSAYDRILQRGVEHEAGVPAARPRSETFRPVGSHRSAAYGAARSGNFAGIVQSIEGVRSFDNPQQAMLEAQDGITLALEDEGYPLEQAQAVAADPSLPPWIRSAASAAIARRGDVRFGSNQARPRLPVSGASDEDLMRAVQSRYQYQFSPPR